MKRNLRTSSPECDLIPCLKEVENIVQHTVRPVTFSLQDTSPSNEASYRMI
jgi:hypothetical protein